MTVNAIQNLNLQTQSGSDADVTQVIDLKPTTVSLGTVTGVTTSSGTTTYYADFIDFFSARASFSSINFENLTTAAYNALSALSSGDTLTLGPWASNDGNPTSVTVDFTDGSESYLSVYYSSSASNLNAFVSPSAYSSSDYVSISSTNTEVTTDNSSLALSQTYFEIGNVTPFVSADATVSGSTVTVTGDFSSSISAGMSVVEKNYASGPSVQQYNLVTGAWVDYAQSSVWSSPTTLTAAHRGWSGINMYSANGDYMWGITQIEIPSDWDDWVIEVDAVCNTSMSNATGTNVAYFELRMITNPTSVGGDKLTINGTSRQVQRETSVQVYNSSYVPGTPRTLCKRVFLSPTLNQYHLIGMHTVINKPVIDNWDSFESTTEVCVYAWIDPRFQQGVAGSPDMKVIAKRTG